MDWFKNRRTGFLLWIIGALTFAALAYFVDGDHASYALAGREKMSAEASAAVFGLVGAIVIGVISYVMFETSRIANAVIILISAAWLVRLYFSA